MSRSGKHVLLAENPEVQVDIAALEGRLLRYSRRYSRTEVFFSAESDGMRINEDADFCFEGSGGGFGVDLVGCSKDRGFELVGELSCEPVIPIDLGYHEGLGSITKFSGEIHWSEWGHVWLVGMLHGADG